MFSISSSNKRYAAIAAAKEGQDFESTARHVDAEKCCKLPGYQRGRAKAVAFRG